MPALNFELSDDTAGLYVWNLSSSGVYLALSTATSHLSNSVSELSGAYSRLSRRIFVLIELMVEMLDANLSLAPLNSSLYIPEANVPVVMLKVARMDL